MKIIALLLYVLVAVGFMLQSDAIDAPPSRIFSGVIWPLVAGMVLADHAEDMRAQNSGRHGVATQTEPSDWVSRGYYAKCQNWSAVIAGSYALVSGMNTTRDCALMLDYKGPLFTASRDGGVTVNMTKLCSITSEASKDTAACAKEWRRR